MLKKRTRARTNVPYLRVNRSANKQLGEAARALLNSSLFLSLFSLSPPLPLSLPLCVCAASSINDSKDCSITAPICIPCLHKFKQGFVQTVAARLTMTDFCYHCICLCSPRFSDTNRTNTSPCLRAARLMPDACRKHPSLRGHALANVATNPIPHRKSGKIWEQSG